MTHTASRPASGHSVRHSLKAETRPRLTYAGLQDKEWARPSSWGIETGCRPDTPEPQGKPDSGAGRRDSSWEEAQAEGGRGSETRPPGHAH